MLTVHTTLPYSSDDVCNIIALLVPTVRYKSTEIWSLLAAQWNASSPRSIRSPVGDSLLLICLAASTGLRAGATSCWGLSGMHCAERCGDEASTELPWLIVREYCGFSTALMLSPRRRLPLYIMALAPWLNLLPNPTGSSDLFLWPVALLVIEAGGDICSESSIASSFATDVRLGTLRLSAPKEVVRALRIESDGCLFCPIKVEGFGEFCENICEYSVMEFDRLCRGAVSVMLVLLVLVEERERRSTTSTKSMRSDCCALRNYLFSVIEAYLDVR